MYLLRSIQLRNIKSHAESPEVSFTKGVNLIIGDIGAGKSTILEAVEACLLGYRVKDVLRIGARAGEIKVVLEPYLEVYRYITNEGTKRAHLIRDNKVYRLASTELRQSVIKILKLMEQANPNAEPIVTRSAIYVRQEELKRILDEPEKANEVVRRATGIMKYTIARENSVIVGKEFEKEAEILRGKIEEYEKEVKKEEDVRREKERAERRLKELKAKLEEVRRSLNGLLKRDEELTREREMLSKSYHELSSKLKELRDRLRRLNEELREGERKPEDLQQKRKALEEQGIEEGGEDKLKEVQKEIERVIEVIKEVRELKGKIDAIKLEKSEVEEELKNIKVDSCRKVEEVQKEIEEAQLRLEKLSEELGALKNDEKNYRMLIEKGICPVCKREIKPEEFSAHLKEVENRKKLAEEEYSSLKSKYEELKEELSKAREYERKLELLSRKEAKEAELRKLEERLRAEKEVELRHKELEERKERIERGIRWTFIINEEKELKEKIEKRKNEKLEIEKAIRSNESMFEDIEKKLKSVENELLIVKEGVEKLREEETSFKVEIGKCENNIENAERRLKEIDEKKRELEKLKAKMKRKEAFMKFFLKVLPSYLENIESIETRQVRTELESRFSEYFSILTQNEDWDVAVDSDFRPIFKARIDGKWREVPMPSGGQRSSIALAYRLALSWVARKHQGLNVGFILLDEPTDGFSSEQLTRFKSLLDRLEADQVIIVSHHEELQSTADRIIKVENVDGVSRVTIIS